MGTPSARLRLLGCPAIETEDGPTSGPAVRRHPIALAAILAAHAGEVVARDRLMALLWPESDTERARSRLRVALHALRDLLGRAAVRSVGDSLRLDPASVSCDVCEFERAVNHGSCELAVAAYGGPFLDGFHLPESVEFDQWAGAQRDRLARAYLDALERLGEQTSATGDMRAAAEWWHKRASQEPSNGRVALRAMEALEGAGDPAAALRQYDAYVRILREEFESVPAPEIVAVAERIRLAPSAAIPVSLPAARAESGFTPPESAAIVVPTDRAEAVSQGRVGAGLPSPVSQLRRAAVALLGLTFLIALALMLHFGAPDTLIGTGEFSARDPVVLADFQGVTGDTLLSRVVTEALRVDFKQSSAFTVIDPARVQAALAAMRRPAFEPLDEAAAREVAVRLGAKGVVSGAIARAGSGYVLTAQVISADSGRVLAPFRETASDSTVLIRAIEKLSRAIRRRVGESLASVRSSRPLGLVTTNSFPALRKWAEAGVAEARGDRDRAFRLLEDAVGLDREFASAWLLMAALHVNDNRRGPSLDATERALAVADRLTESELHGVRLMYALTTGDLRWAQAEARGLEPVNWVTLSHIAWVAGDFHAAETYAARIVDSLTLSRGKAPWVAYWNLAVAQLDQGKISEARATAHASEVTGSGVDQNLHWLIDFAEGNYERAASRSIDGPLRRGQTHFVRGRMQEAGAELGEFATIAFNARQVPLHPVARTLFAISRYLIVGEDSVLDSVAALVPDSMPDSLNEQLLLEIGVAFAMSGRVEAAGLVRMRYEERVPARARWQDLHLLEAMDAHLALAAGRPADAVAGLHRARQLTPWTAPVDALLGRLYDRLGVTDSAIAAYTRYIRTPWAHRGGMYTSMADPTLLVPAHERLASLLLSRGDTEASAQHARRIVEIWSGADPELQARAAAARRLVDQQSR